MRILEGELLSSASDLNDFLACEHRVALHRDAIVANEPPPERDPTLEVLAKKGFAHEQASLERYRASGRRITRIADGDASGRSLLEAVALTREAMTRGDDVIYQPAFLLDGWTGRADFLVRVPGSSALGDFVYEIADAKLAVREKATFLVQLCMYARFVAAVQGVLPPRVIALLGSGDEFAYDPARYIAYVDSARERYRAGFLHLDATRMPDRVGACGGCTYEDRCDDRRRGVDHLAFVAGIRGSQITRLRECGITTLTQLAEADPSAPPRGMAAQTFRTLARQARLQQTQRISGKPVYELFAPTPGTGFAMLPTPDRDFDVYFDIEGDPLFEPGVGLEYLFGVYTRAGGYVAFWGETRAEERTAFEALMDWFTAHRRDHPSAYIYHYASYEKSALQRLAMRHGTREEEVDALLRRDVLVDLFTVVRGAFAQSHESYSIKKLEKFYAFRRTAEVKKGDDSIVAFERYLADRDPQTRTNIINYNDEDCVSTAHLHDWLLHLRAEAVAQFGEIAWCPPTVPNEKPEALEERDRRDALVHALLAGPNGEEGGTDDPDRRLLASLLAYHRREAKPVWWKFFDRCNEAREGEDFVDDAEALGCLELSPDHPPIPGSTARAHATYTYTYPPQPHKLKVGSLRDPHRGKDGKSVAVVDFDDDRRLVQIKHAADAPAPRALVPGGPLATKEQQRALQCLADAVLDGSAEEGYPAAMALLRRSIPNIAGLAPGSRVQPAEREGAIAPSDVADLVMRLTDSALVVQGPPGSGKTYTGARVIGALLAAGRRVGVTATGHFAINNLLHATESAVRESGGSFRGVKKSDGDKAFVSRLPVAFIENVGENSSFEDRDLVAGTAWLMTRDDLDPLDIVVIDEAGQVSLADALAIATCARSVLLLGDPLQLAQVSLGTHPEGAGGSVLDHLIGEGTIATDRGVFLERSYRMHPAICAFISHMMYDGRLAAADACANQRIDSAVASGAGLRYVPISHTANSQSSREEAEAVADIVAGLVGGTFTDAKGMTRAMLLDDVLIVAPYNAQVTLIRATLRARFGADARVGTVDKFQGQEAPAVIYSLAASSAEDAPRGADFLLEENRFNVAVSRGRAMAFLVCSPRLPATPCGTIEQLRAAAAFCAFEAAAVEPATRPNSEIR